MDTVPGAKTFDDLNVSQSTISRYACRIVVSRHPPYTARIYAAGFDGSKSIFLGV
jgi:pellino protein